MKASKKIKIHSEFISNFKIVEDHELDISENQGRIF